ncbi:MAG: hypothetical protein ACFFD1_15035, partial [Candidatus Thorarchaeota archaeon]
MEEFVFKPIRLQTLQSLHMPILNHFSLFSSLTFLIIYLVLNGAFKIFSASELEYLETLIHSEKKQSRFITIMLKLFKKILCWRS